MIVDTSALMAILLAEPDADVFARRLEESAETWISAGTLVEAGIVTLKRVGGRDTAALAKLMESASIGVAELKPAQSLIAIEAYRAYGKGAGQKPCLNFGDCFAYALAKSLDQPLLYKGDDFSRTDIRSAL